MANSRSAEKRVRQNEKNRAANKSRTSRMKTLEKKFIAKVAEKDVAGATALLSEVTSAYDKATKTGLVHANRTDRKKAQFHAKLRSLQA